MPDGVPERTKLEEISAELPERERRELLAKISKTAERGETEEIARVELPKEERERILAQEMSRLSAWERFLIWLSRLFTGRSKRDVFLSHKLRSLKRAIKQKNPGITGFETRNLTPRFARQLFDLHAAVFPLKGVFQHFSMDQEFRGEAVRRLMQARHEGVKEELEEFVPMEEMETIYADTGGDEEIRKQILRRYNEYVRSIPDRLFKELEEGIKPLVYLRALVLFPFSGLFRHFNYYLGDRLDDKYPYFDHAPVMLMLDLLERLCYATYLALKLGAGWFCHEEILRFHVASALELEEGRQPDQEELAEEAAELAASLRNAFEVLGRFDSRTNLLDLIRYFRKDPYYRLVFGVPRLNVKALYTAGLREHLMEQLEERMPAIRRNVVERKIREIFKTDQLLELFYYNEQANFDYLKLGLPYFSYPKSLRLLYNFLSRLYKGYIQEIVQIVNTYVLQTNRIMQNRLMQCAAGLEELEAKIVLLDRSLGPEEDDGKALMRYRHRIASDIGQQKLYRGLVAQKDREAREMLDRGEESMLCVKRVFDDTAASPMESVRSVLKTIHFYHGKNQTLASLLRYGSELIRDYHELHLQLLETEKGL